MNWWEKYPDLIKCWRCEAVYADIDWLVGYDANGPKSTATTRFVATGKVARGNCPMCRRPPRLKKDDYD